MATNSKTPDLVVYSSPSVAAVTCYDYSASTPYKKPLKLGGDYVGAVAYKTGVGQDLKTNHYTSFSLGFNTFKPSETLTPITIAIAPYSGAGFVPHKAVPALILDPTTAIVKRTTGSSVVIVSFGANALRWLNDPNNGNKPFAILMYGSPNIECEASFSAPTRSSVYESGAASLPVMLPISVKQDGGWVRRQGFVKQATANKWKEIVRCKEGR